MTIHLAYAIPRTRSRVLTRLLRVSARAAAGAGLAPYYRRGRFPLLPRPLNLPDGITVRLARALSQHQPVRVYDLSEHADIRVAPDDILLMHPHADPRAVVRYILDPNVKCRLKALIFPIHHALPEGNRYSLPFVAAADLTFGIMGPYWADTIAGSIFGPYKEKIIRLDLAVDPVEYPFVRQRFNPPGKRGFLYIGRNGLGKGFDVMNATMQRLAQFPHGWIGSGQEIPHMPRIATFMNFSPARVRQLMSQYDFFVNFSTSDPNPTTILESMAWGFPVACTPQSGYYNMPTIIQLSTTDIDANVAALRRWQETPENELMDVALRSRRLVENEYTWERFCRSVWSRLEPQAPRETP